MLDLKPAAASDAEAVAAAPPIDAPSAPDAAPRPSEAPSVTAFDFVAERSEPLIEPIDTIATMFGITADAARPDAFHAGAFHSLAVGPDALHPNGLHAEDHAAAEAADDAPWLGRLMKRAAVTLLVVLFGSAATFAWRVHGNDVRQLAAAWTPGLVSGWLTAGAVEPAGPPAAQAAEASAPQPAAPPPSQAAADAALPPPDGVLQSMARDLDKAQQAIEQLRSNQDQLARQVAKLNEQEARRRPPAPPRQAFAAVRKPAPLVAAAQPASPPRPASSSPAVAPAAVQPQVSSVPRPPAALP